MHRARSIEISELAKAIGRYRDPIVISTYGVPTPAFAIQNGLMSTSTRWSAIPTNPITWQPFTWRPSSAVSGSQRLRPNEFFFYSNNWLYQQGLPEDQPIVVPFGTGKVLVLPTNPCIIQQYIP
jgi:hypothetical protein